MCAGDDCVSIGSGSYDLDIRNITCGPSHGIRYCVKYISAQLVKTLVISSYTFFLPLSDPVSEVSAFATRELASRTSQLGTR